MMTSFEVNRLGIAFLEAVGIDAADVRAFTFRYEVGHLPTIDVEHFVFDAVAETAQVEIAAKSYRLVEITEPTLHAGDFNDTPELVIPRN